MTNDEAISMLEQIGRHKCIWMVCRHNEVYKAIDMAIEALKRESQNSCILDEEASNALMDIILKKGDVE